MKVKVKQLIIAAILNICFVGFAEADLAKEIDGIIKKSFSQKVKLSVSIVKADSGLQVYGYNANEAIIPASNMKLIVAAAALKILGPDYEYKTRVGFCGDTLVITGSGDPLLGDEKTDAKYSRGRGWIFEDIVAKLKEKGITEVNDIVIDSSIFDDQRVHPNWSKEQLNRWYASEVSGLNFNGNCVEVTAKTVGNRVELEIWPQTSFVEITNKCKPTSQSPNTVWCSRLYGTNKLTVFGKCYKECQPVCVTVDNPSLFFGHVLAENINRAGIKTDGQVLEKPLGEDCRFEVIAEYGSSIGDCLARCNKNSFQLAAEALLKTVAADSSPDKKNGSWVKGQEAVSRYLLGLGISKDEFNIDDGSGLSRENRLSANAITMVLSDVYKGKDWAFYKDSLAVGGVDGTIGKYFKEEKYKGKIFGKTGFINGVKSFSGVCSTDGGDYIFSILTNNNWQSRGTINDIAKAIIDTK